MHSSVRLASTLVALSTLISALPQQSAQNTAVAYNPINGLPLPVAESTATATASTSKPTSNNDDDEDTETEPSSAKATITAAPTLSPTSPPSHKSSSDSDSETETDTDTDSSSTTDTESSPSSPDPSLIIWTDTAENTIYTMTRVSSTSTSSIPIPTMGVPPNSDQVHPTVVMVEITNSAGQEEVVPTSNVDTFVQAYTGKAAPRERVWWLLGVIGGVAALL